MYEPASWLIIILGRRRDGRGERGRRRQLKPALRASQNCMFVNLEAGTTFRIKKTKKKKKILLGFHR